MNQTQKIFIKHEGYTEAEAAPKQPQPLKTLTTGIIVLAGFLFALFIFVFTISFAINLGFKIV